MRFHRPMLGLAAVLALAACGTPQSGPPPSGTSAGAGSPNLQQQTGAIAGGSANASAGTPTVTGNTTSGNPSITYSGTAGNAGSPTPTTLPTVGRSRSN